jgi:hypothetical protein
MGGRMWMSLPMKLQKSSGTKSHTYIVYLRILPSSGPIAAKLWICLICFDHRTCHHASWICFLVLFDSLNEWRERESNFLVASAKFSKEKRDPNCNSYRTFIQIWGLKSIKEHDKKTTVNLITLSEKY